MNDSVERRSYRMISIRQREILVRTVLIGLSFFASIRPYRFHSLWMGSSSHQTKLFWPPCVFSSGQLFNQTLLSAVCLYTPISVTIFFYYPRYYSHFSISVLAFDWFTQTLQFLVILIGPILYFDEIDTFLSSLSHVRTYVCVFISCIFYFLVT